jgi:hypothetical protein
MADDKEAVSPPGWGKTVEKMKEDHSDEIDNPFALAWWMHGEGYTPHKSAADEFQDALSSERVANRFARRFTPEGWEKYRAKHPGAKKENHSIVQRRDSSPEGKAKAERLQKSIKEDLDSRKPKAPAKSDDPRAEGKKLINKAQKAKAGKPAHNAWSDAAKHLRSKGDHEGANHAEQEAAAHRVKMNQDK